MRRSHIAVSLAIVITWSCYTFYSFLQPIGKRLTSNVQTRHSHGVKDPTVPFWKYSTSVPGPGTRTGKVSRLGFRIYQDKIDSIRVLGERHSGTSFMTRYLQSCFPNTSVNEYFVNAKHWFQPSPEYVMDTANRFGESGLNLALFAFDSHGRRDVVGLPCRLGVPMFRPSIPTAESVDVVLRDLTMLQDCH